GFFLAMAYQQLGERAMARTWYDCAEEWLKGYEKRCAEREKHGKYTRPEPALLRRMQDEAAALLGVAPPGRSALEIQRSSRDRSGDTPGASASRAGWTPLFNGKDLSGWTVDSGERGSWRVENGDLVADGTGDATRSGYLLSDRDYSHFRL